jgi:hypothetical protein
MDLEARLQRAGAGGQQREQCERNDLHDGYN